MADSIFTKIINREIPADIVYEDDVVIAILDINPINKGHTLIIPKQPFVNALDGDEEQLAHMMRVAKRLSNVISEAVNADGINITMNNGEVAGQEVFHAHLHVIPRHKGDNAFAGANRCDCYEENEAHTLATQLSAALGDTK